MEQHNDRCRATRTGSRHTTCRNTRKATDWPKLAYLISELADDWEHLIEFADDLSITDVLIGHVRPQHRFLLDRWLSTIKRIDQHIGTACEIVAGFEDAVLEHTNP